MTYPALIAVVFEELLGARGGDLHDELVHGRHLLLIGHAQDGPLQLLRHRQCSVQLPAATRPKTCLPASQDKA